MHFKSQVYTKYLTSFPIGTLDQFRTSLTDSICVVLFFNQWTINYKL